MFCMSFQLNAQNNTFYLVVGTYTQTGKSEGLYVYRFNADSVTARLNNKVVGQINPSYLCFSKDGRFLYTVNEAANNAEGGVTAFTFNKQSGALSFLNHQQTGGDGPCYISVTSDNKYAFAANYWGGSLSALKINEDGSLNSDVQLIQNTGSSINPVRQTKPYVHAAVLSPDEKFLLSTDLGTDRINIYTVNAYGSKEALSQAPMPFLSVKPGSGPRHLTFHPNGKTVYLLHEMDGSVSILKYRNGTLHLRQSTSLVDKSDTARAQAADIHTSPDGKFLYASNRGDANKLAIFKIKRNGKIRLIGHQSTLGFTPRNFAIDPTGNYLLAANQNSDNIVIFTRNKKTGFLTPTGKKINVGSPSCLQFFPVK